LKWQTDNKLAQDMYFTRRNEKNKRQNSTTTSIYD
jgi:hypothetical protein